MLNKKTLKRVLKHTCAWLKENPNRWSGNPSVYAKEGYNGRYNVLGAMGRVYLGEKFSKMNQERADRWVSTNIPEELREQLLELNDRGNHANHVANAVSRYILPIL